MMKCQGFEGKFDIGNNLISLQKFNSKCLSIPGIGFVLYLASVFLSVLLFGK